MAAAAVSVAEAAASGDRRRALEALRDALAEGVDAASDRHLIHRAPLARQLADVLEQLSALPVPNEGTPLDDLARRRAAAGAAEGAPRARRRTVRGQ